MIPTKTSPIRSRILIALIAAPLLASTGCELELIGEYLPLEEDDFVPMRHVAAVSDDQDHVFVASAVTGGLRVVSSDGDLIDEFVLNAHWRPIAAATYHGPAFEFAGVEQSDAAVIVLHANGIILPWFHHAGELRYHLPGWMNAVNWPVLGEVQFIDVDMSPEGSTWVLAEETSPTGQTTVFAYQDLDENGNYTSGGSKSMHEPKSVALAYDPHADTITVAFSRTDDRDVTLKEFDHFTLVNDRTLPDVLEVTDLEVLAGWHYVGVLACDDAACDEHTAQLQVRDSNLDLDDALDVATEAVALEVPPLPLNQQSTVDVWRAGRAPWQLSQYDAVP